MPEDEIEQQENIEDAQEDDIEDEQLIANQLSAQQEAQRARIAEEKKTAQNQQSPMSLGLFIPLIILCIIGDVIDFFTGGTIGWVIGLFIDAIIMIATGISKSGRKQFKRIVVGLLAETIPIIDALPFRTISLTWGFVKSRSTIAQVIDSKLSTTSKIASRTT